MRDFFEELEIKLNNKNNSIEIIKCNKVLRKISHDFNLFEFGISDDVKFIYDNYEKFVLHWEEKSLQLHGFVNFVPYENVFEEHEALCEMVKLMDDYLIDDQEIVIEDIAHWYPIFKFPNGDAFCYDKRNGKIVFYEHDVFDCGINLHGMIIADSIDVLFDNWSKVLFIDIYDWFEGVNEMGIDLSKDVFRQIFQVNTISMVEND